VIFSDQLNHASIVDGCRLSRAEIVVYRHLDVDHLEWCVRRHGPRRDGTRRRLVVTDAVFSMDGDVAPLEDIVDVARAVGARVVVDEAHATGTLGPEGRGACAQAGLEREIDVIVGTLGKALGSYGAYACGESEMVRYLLNASRPFIFSTAPPPPAVAGALAALALLQERPERTQRLHANARALRGALAAEGFAVAPGDMPIVPLVVGAEDAAMDLCQHAIERGVFAQAIRPPTVPAGTSRLRLAAMASHTASDMRLAARVLGESARELGLDPGRIGAPSAGGAAAGARASAAATAKREASLAPEAHALAAERPYAPFDHERAAPRLQRPYAPFDHERAAPSPERVHAPFDRERAMRGADPPRVPFDRERDANVPRAA
jgi:glycine C-acetyltransferase/8-amino-7-oxononanoate synthase